MGLTSVPRNILLLAVLVCCLFLTGRLWWEYHLASYKAPREKVLASEIAIRGAVRFEREMEALLSRGVSLRECEQRWRMNAQVDGWGASLQIQILNRSPFEYTIWTLTPWPEVNVIEYDSRHPEKGVYEYRF